MGGKIDVQSEPGRGSTFSFTIELPPGHEARSESRSPLQLSQASYRLLLAEDNALNRELIKIMLEQAGHEVVAVNDGAEAVRTAVRNSFDAILMDVQMPEMDGYAATRAIRNAMQDAPTMPIIALTANALPDETERCMEAGMNVYISKPIDWPALLATIDRLVLENRGGRSHEVRPPAGRDATPSASGSTGILDETTLGELRNSIGDRGTARLLGLFVVDARQKFLSYPTSPETHESVADEAHAFGGSAGMLGFVDLAAACRALQSAILAAQPLDEYFDRCRRTRDAVLELIAELVVDDEFTSPMRATA